MISSSCWVPRGVLSEFPQKYELDDEEMERINAMANLQLEDAEAEYNDAQEGTERKTLSSQLDLDNDLKDYDLENYENEDADGEDVAFIPGLSNTDAKIQLNENGEDPYLTLPTEVDIQEERKELQIYPTDNLVLATRTEDDISYLDVYVYDDGAGAPEGADEEEEDKADPDVANGLVRDSNLYVHHDIMLPAFPLCVEWIKYETETVAGGNYAAIGSFDPQIEIWNLDYVDKAFPDLILGEPESNIKKSKKKKSKGHVKSHHTDAVLSLSHNPLQRNVLVSTSADNTVKLWDLKSGTAVASYNTIHSGKTVSSSQWHKGEASILLTGGYDGTCGISDVRLADSNSMTQSFKVQKNEEVESVCWGSDSGMAIFYSGTDNGNVYSFDVRKQEKPLWTLHAHDSGISSLNANSFIPGMIATSAMGEPSVKFWKCSDNTGPSMILSRDFGVGNVLSSSFACDIEVAGHITIGGVSGPLKMWDTLTNSSIRNAFKSELSDLRKSARSVAQSQGRASRIARKYQGTSISDNVIAVDGEDDISDSEDDEGDE